MPRQSVEKNKKVDAKPPVIRKVFHDQPEVCMKNSDDRFKMISDAAYFRALGRGFDGGNPLEDWLLAETEINSLMHEG